MWCVTFDVFKKDWSLFGPFKQQMAVLESITLPNRKIYFLNGKLCGGNFCYMFLPFNTVLCLLLLCMVDACVF